MVNYCMLTIEVNISVKQCNINVEQNIDYILEDISDSISKICEVKSFRDINIYSEESFSVVFILRGNGKEISYNETRFEPFENDIETDLNENKIEMVLNKLNFANFKVEFNNIEKK